MKKGFPYKFLGIIPIGWKYRGMVGYDYDPKENVNVRTGCNLCRTILNVGIENNKAFLYCPKCKEKR